MKFTPRTPPVEGLPGVSGPARLDRRTPALLRRLRRGDVAVLDHLDLDRATAQTMLEAGVVAVVNASSFISGRYPNLGPELLARAGVPLLDAVGPEVFTRVGEGDTVRVHGDGLFVGETQVASGNALTAEQITGQMTDARAGLTSQLQSFTHNTTEFLRREQDLLLHGQGVPPLATSFTGRPVIVVARHYDYRQDLRRLRRFVREQRPLLVGVDAGADALLEAGHRPDVVVAGGSGEPASDKALHAAREVVVHVDGSGRGPSTERLEKIGIRPLRIEASGSTEDVALLIADIRGASTLISVGSHATLDEFLDRQRAGMSSSFLTRLRVGPKLVDAKTVPTLYSGRVRNWQLFVVLLAGLVALAVAIAATPVGDQWSHDLNDWIQGLFS